MSNIIRSHPQPSLEKKVIQLRKIEPRPVNFPAQRIDPGDQKQFLCQEIEALQAQYEKLQSRIETEQKLAKKEIDSWWMEKREQAEQEAQYLAEQAKEQGFQTGHEQGVLQAEEEFRQQKQDMQELIAAAYAEKENIIRQSEPFLLDLSVTIAEKIIKKELKQDAGQLRNIVKQALKRIEESEDITLHVALEDYPILIPYSGEFETYIRPDSKLKIIPVANHSKGGCMIHTASGSYDVTVDGQLEEIKRQLLTYCEEKTTDEPAER